VPSGYLKIKEAKRNNLKSINVDVPLGQLVALTGVSGAGKSSFVDEIIDQYRDIVLVGQGAIGSNKRGCITTYVGAFDLIRRAFASKNNAGIGIFSFNGKGGCKECKGLGFKEMDMNFLGDVKIKCDRCEGLRYEKEVLKYSYQGKNIVDVLNMTAKEAIGFFKESSDIVEKLKLLMDVGLDYVELGQTLDTLSGGEAQRLKLASRLQRKGEFYILDEPTSGLHFADVEKLMKLLNRLVDNGNTVLVVEHNLDVISRCDWVIDLGPEGSEKGGEVVVQGAPQAVAKCERSYTGKALKDLA